MMRDEAALMNSPDAHTSERQQAPLINQQAYSHEHANRL